MGSESRIWEIRPFGSMRGGRALVIGLWPFNPSSPAYSTHANNDGKCDMKLQGSLPETKPCVSPQVFYGSRRPARRAVGSEAFRTMEQTWESQSGGATRIG